jgi:hypothetical protein
MQSTNQYVDDVMLQLCNRTRLAAFRRCAHSQVSIAAVRREREEREIGPGGLTREVERPLPSNHPQCAR